MYMKAKMAKRQIRDYDGKEGGWSFPREAPKKTKGVGLFGENSLPSIRYCVSEYEAAFKGALRGMSETPSVTSGPSGSLDLIW